MSAKRFLDYTGLSHFWDRIRGLRVELTSAQYAELEQAGLVDPKVLYFITDSDVAGRNPDTAMSSTSTNTVQNKVIKAYVDSRITLVPDTEMSDSSTNPVQNKVIKSYVDNKTYPMDNTMSDSSTNAVQNKIIKKYVDDNKTMIDSEMSDSSTNPVQNKTVKEYIDEQISALRTELLDAISSMVNISVSDTAPSDTSKVWIDTGAN